MCVCVCVYVCVCVCGVNKRGSVDILSRDYRMERGGEG